MPTDPLPSHIERPHLRPIQPVPVMKDGKQLVALRDPAMLVPQTMVVPVQVMGILQHLQGRLTLEELSDRTGGDLRQLTELVKNLDQLGLLWGPRFEQMESQRWEELQQEGAFPVRSSNMLGEDESICRNALEEYFQETEDPEIDGPVIGLVAPHLDYERGWPNYAAAYYGLRERTAPERVVVLGTNHNGLGDGVVLSELGFDTPLGRCRADKAVTDRLVERLGRPLIADQLDHLSEHSIELQLPWIQYCFGNVPIVAALIPDPLVPMIAEDGQRTPLEPFVDALSETLGELGGETLLVASSDLSHVGPQFGEPRAVDDQRRLDVERHDREMMSKFVAGDPEEFLAAMAWNKNPTRWCSIGNMAALLMLARPRRVELIDYRQAYDERGMALVSSAAMALA
ncbi:MAG: AmmeMemoRadiSam system protein B [Planctomycetota bacterium]|nr:AmmeMemoRadiSam system protein B [Planctomycetota bacterium]